MSDKKGTMSEKKGNIEVPTLTDRDFELLIGALRCVEGGFPKPDLQKFATMAGFKTPASASVSLNLLKKKIMGDAASTKSTPKKKTPNKRKAASEAANGEGDESDESPTKKSKPTPKKAAKKKAEPEQQSGDDEGTAFV